MSAATSTFKLSEIVFPDELEPPPPRGPRPVSSVPAEQVAPERPAEGEKAGEGGRVAQAPVLPVASEGGEGGEAGNVPLPPPLPPSPGPNGEASAADDASAAKPAGQVVGEVYTPAPDENPVLAAFKANNLFEATTSLGVHQVICPWANEHDRPGTWRTTYREPDALRRLGSFTCEHPHSSKLNIYTVIDFFDIDSAAASGKAIIRIMPGEMHRVADGAEQVLASFDDYFQYGNLIVRVRTDPDTGDIRTEPLNDGSLAKALSAGARWLRWDGQGKQYVATDPLPRHVTMLLRAQDYKFLPRLKGLARQPYLRPDGVVIRNAGYDPEAKTFGAFTSSDFPLPEPTEAAAREALLALKALVAEFHLRSDHDRAASVAAMLTAAMRSQLPLAPAFNISASMSGSGKSFLANLIALFAGPGLPMNVSYPVRADEAGKAILTMLMTQPSVILFDDMQTNWIPHSIINRMLTAEMIEDRKLGGNEVARVSTATLVMGTGNNVEPEKDTRRRVVSIYLAPQADTPATLRYNSDPVETVRQARGRYVGHALTIVRAWIAAGRPMTDVPEIGSYSVWSALCRQPLLWLGEPDPATSLIEQVEADPEADALATLLAAWHAEFGRNAAMLRTIVDRAEDNPDGDLWQAMQELPFMGVKGIDRNRFGHYLKKNVNRFANGLTLVRYDCAERNAWAVVPAGKMPTGLETHVKRRGHNFGPAVTVVKAATKQPAAPIVNDPTDIF